jgi:hypothetical protein
MQANHDKMISSFYSSLMLLILLSLDEILVDEFDCHILHAEVYEFVSQTNASAGRLIKSH